eukprot:augustus_masked-scaffold_11-processed-gene-7.60-mRNA-1 protein AED:0.12 eAED:0.13 QI:0/0/0/1/1/1/2/0/391
MDTIPGVAAVVILDAEEGVRIHAKHFMPQLRLYKQQVEYEARLFNKTKSSSSKKTSNEYEAILMDNPSSVCVYRQTSDSIFYVIGNSQENEIMLMSVLKGLYESLSSILRQNLSKKNLLMSLDVVLLAVDELVDGGLILEVDPRLIAQRVLMKDGSGGDAGEVNVGEMTVAQAWETARKQAFLSTPVPIETLKEVLTLAARAASGGNTQPWHVHVLSTKDREVLYEKVSEAFPGNLPEPEFSIYPPASAEPKFMDRRRKVGYDMYGLMKIDRKDKMGRFNATMNNYKFFGAPIGLIVTVHRACDKNGWGHVGMYLATLDLLCEERGIQTCFEEAWSSVNQIVYDHLNIDKEKEVIWCGMAIGYADKDAPVNQLVTEREPLEEFVTFHNHKL